jgi:hypothetical protein
LLSTNSKKDEVKQSSIMLTTLDPLSGVKERWSFEFTQPSQVDNWPPKLERAAGLFVEKQLRHRNAPSPEVGTAWM